MNTNSRVTYLDGHRGLAILLVIFFHAYARWPGIVPYGSKYANISIFKFGWLGVELFFLISGYVILMTLEKCENFKEFIYRRWIRLFPAMLICSILIYITSFYFYERPAGKPSIDSLLPGLTFIEPSWWKIIFRSFEIKPLEGAFWSMYVEVKFYFFAAFIYFWKGKNWLIATLFLFFALSVICNLVNNYSPCAFYRHAVTVVDLLSFNYFGWFASGSSFYLFTRTKELKWFSIAICFAILSSVFVNNFELQSTLAACIVSALFTISVGSSQLQRILSNRFLLFFGFISYPLYLIHENMMISMIVKLGSENIRFANLSSPLLSIAALSCIAYGIALHAEPFIKKCCQLMMTKFQMAPIVPIQDQTKQER